MKKPRLLLDVDEVLCDFATPASAVVTRLTGKVPDPREGWDLFQSLSGDELAVVFHEFKKPGFCASLAPSLGALEVWEELRELAEVFVVTSPMHGPYWVHERDEWLQRHFQMPRKRVVHTSAKYLVVGDALLDDKPANVADWEEHHPGKLALLWATPWNEHHAGGHRQVRSWPGLLDILRRHHK